MSSPVVHPPNATVAPRPNDGSQPSHTEKIRISTIPIRKVGSATPTSEQIISTWLERGAGAARSRRRAECRAAVATSMAHRLSSSVAGSRSIDQPADRHAEPIRHAEIAASAFAQEAHELQDTRIVEAERAAHRLAIGHARGLPDHVVDRIADVAEHREADERRREDDEDRLRQALDEERSHGDGSRVSGSQRARRCRCAQPQSSTFTHLSSRLSSLRRCTDTPLRTPQARPA